MHVEYNEVSMELCDIQSVHRTAVWSSDHVDLLYIIWNVGLVCAYSPNGYPPGMSVFSGPASANFIAGPRLISLGAAGDILKGKDTPLPVFQQRRSNFPVSGVAPFGAGAGAIPTLGDRFSGHAAIISDGVLFNRLMTPRKKLKITGGDPFVGPEVTWIEAPRPGSACDPMLGPHPIACDVIQVGGDGTAFGVFFQIETATLPCMNAAERLVLSHRWTMSHTHDRDRYLTRVIDGEVIFNGEMIHTLGVNIDDFRQQFFHPIPPGHERHIVHITPSSDGLTYNYRIEDTDSTIVFDAGDSGATRIEIAEKVGYYQPWRVLGGAVNSIEKMFSGDAELRAGK